MSRIQQVIGVLESGALDAVVLSSPVNRRYVSGFTGTAGTVVVSRERAWFVTDFRYTEQAAQQCQGFEVVTLKPEEKFSEWLAALEFRRIGFEANHWTVEGFELLKAPGTEADWIPVQTAIAGLRQVKDDGEQAAIAQAAEIGDRAFSHICGFLKPGLTELEVALELEFFMRRQGASALSFESIVASGQRSSMPHGTASSKVIESGDFVTLDFGCVWNGYCSDMTRTVVVGKASEDQRRLYETVLNAQLASLEAVKAGVPAAEVDRAGRSLIEAAGHGPRFGHGTGHGVGLEIHEAPRVSSTSETILKAGMAITIEPGIYLPDFGGVRIEDLVIVTEDGYRNLCHSTKRLLEL